ncbi:MAG TPA: chemotaxis protein CheB [Candidatus Limnocylindria bacterium]
MTPRDIVVIGASAGGIDALRQLVAHLPGELRAALFVTMHVSPGTPSVLAAILRRSGPLPAFQAADRERIRAGRIYVAPPDRHLLIEPGSIRLSAGPRENRSRPAVDPLFRSAATAYGERVVGVVLSGTLDDGAWGLVAIRDAGGLALVQDPSEAAFDGMPRAALRLVDDAQSLPVQRIAETIARAAGGGNAEVVPDRDVALEGDPVADTSIVRAVERDGDPSPFTCPECGGALWREEGDRFRCRVGHSYTEDALGVSQGERVESALWAAERALAERAHLARRLQERATEQGREHSAERFDRDASLAEGQAAAVRELIDGVLGRSA